MVKREGEHVDTRMDDEKKVDVSQDSYTGGKTTRDLEDCQGPLVERRSDERAKDGKKGHENVGHRPNPAVNAR